MGKVALLFSGQGAQYPGMGKDIYDNSAAAKDVYERLEAIRPGIMDLCFNSTPEELKITVNTQPAMFATECAIAAALEENGFKADAVAGFSLGEIAALASAKVLSVEDAFRLVIARAKIMQSETEKVESGMTAVLKLDAETVEELCSRVEGVYPVNYNCPGQVVVSGKASLLPAFEEEVKKAGGRAMRLAVSGAFHSPYMGNASAHFSKELEGYTFQEPALPIYSNVTGKKYEGDMKRLLAQQISSPVRWQTLIQSMMAGGVDRFVETGPGTTLTGLVKKISKEVECLSAATWETLKEVQ